MSTSSHAPILGAAIADRRRHLHLSPTELAHRCHMEVADLRRIEQGRFAPSPSQAYQLAQELRLDSEPFCRAAILHLLVHPEYLAEHVARAT